MTENNSASTAAMDGWFDSNTKKTLLYSNKKWQNPEIIKSVDLIIMIET